ncbi:MAG: hypothetical protein ACKO9V_00695, partial [Candidatus Kapaibacterium sp.]
MNINTSLVTGALKSQKADGIAMFFFSNDQAFRRQKTAVTAMFPETKGVLSSGDFTGAKGSVVMAYAGQG